MFTINEIKNWINELSEKSWFLDTTEAAVKLGNPILGNTICVGALAGTGVLPLSRAVFEDAVTRKMSPDKVDLNLSAYDMGVEMIGN